MFSLFAFGTGQVEGDDWLIREGARFMRIANDLSIPAQYIRAGVKVVLPSY